MKKAIISLFLLTCVFGLKAQINLVKNPSFESYRVCPNRFGEVSAANYWSAIVDTDFAADSAFICGGSVGNVRNWNGAECFPYYCNECDNATVDPSLNATVPFGEFWYHYPRTGKGMMWADLFSCDVAGNLNDRMYTQGRLYSTLVAGKNYCVTFYVVNCISSGVGCNHIGAYLDDGTIDTTHECGPARNNDTPQVFTDSIITDTTNWTKIQGSFIAKGNERFITIGNFSDSAHTGIRNCNSLGEPMAAFYLIDDVSVIALDDTAYAGPDQNIPYGSTDSVQIGDTAGYLPCYWYASQPGGVWVLIDSNTSGFKVFPDTTTAYVMQLDVCGNITTDTITVWVWNTGVQTIGKASPLLSIQPNPTNNKITVTGAPGCILHLYNAIGQQLLTLPAATSKQELDLTNLPTGTYTLQAIDTTTGEKVSRRVLKE